MARTLAAAGTIPLARPTPSWRAHPFFRHRSAVIGAVIVALVLLVALAANVLATHDPLYLDPMARFSPPGESGHLLGTDNQGRDTYSRAVYGARLSLLVGVGVSLGTVVFGVFFGLLAGYFRKLDGPLMRVMDSMMAFPGVVLAIAIMAAIGPRVENVLIALTVVYTPRLARVIRSVVLTVRDLQYVEAAHALGISTPRILLRHIVPNCRSPVIVQATFIFADAILAEAGLSFLGVGTPPYIPSWGNMLGEARNYLSQAPWTMLVPGAFLMVAVLGLNLLGDGIRDLLDPRLRKL